MGAFGIPFPPFPSLPIVPGAPQLLSGSVTQILGVQNVMSAANGSISSAVRLITGAGNPITGVLPLLSDATGSINGAIEAIAGGVSQVGSVQDLLTSSLGSIGGAQGLLGAAGNPIAQVQGLLDNASSAVQNIQTSISGAVGLLSGGLSDILTGDTPTIAAGSAAPQWGLFDSGGNDVIGADSVNTVEYRKEYNVSTFPIEQGGFASYNKVEKPYDARIAYLQGGSQSDRNNFIDTLESVVASLDLYTLIMPEFSWQNANVVHYELATRKSDTGVTLLRAELWVQEIRQASAPTFSNTAQPSGADSVNDGAVQPFSPDPTEAAGIAGLIL